MNDFNDSDLFLGNNVKFVKLNYSFIGNMLISKPIIASKQYIDGKLVDFYSYYMLLPHLTKENIVGLYSINPITLKYQPKYRKMWGTTQVNDPNSITQEEFDKLLKIAMNNNSSLTVGEYLFTLVWEKNVDLVYGVIGTDADPFESDENIYNFMKKIVK